MDTLKDSGLSLFSFQKLLKTFLFIEYQHIKRAGSRSVIARYTNFHFTSFLLLSVDLSVCSVPVPNSNESRKKFKFCVVKSSYDKLNGSF